MGDAERSTERIAKAIEEARAKGDPSEASETVYEEFEDLTPNEIGDVLITLTRNHNLGW
ncbi:hypothetical protein [Streptomyces nanshensis]|uniref:hypothetical protein n=1 Tax=Streptomyces nanshensis TaxID=518642 RepID=UPI0014956DAA|nr:hypothetical protein [Streptomyces nanshensis]